MPAGAVLYSPMTDMTCSGESMVRNAKADVMFSTHLIPQTAKLYLGGRSSKDPLASPVFADLRGLPELFIFASESEVLMSDSVQLQENAQKAGVRSTLTLRPGMPHVWPIIIYLPEAQADLKLSADFIARVTALPQARAV